MRYNSKQKMWQETTKIIFVNFVRRSFSRYFNWFSQVINWLPGIRQWSMKYWFVLSSFLDIIAKCIGVLSEIITAGIILNTNFPKAQFHNSIYIEHHKWKRKNYENKREVSICGICISHFFKWTGFNLHFILFCFCSSVYIYP